MKNVETSILLFVAATFSVPALAQSSVTLYGSIDEGPEYNSNAGGKQLYNLTTAALGGSRWGIRGVEDLGGGMSALFRLENGFDDGTGKLLQGGLLFGRQAYAGLSSSRLGTITFGRQYDSEVDYVGPVTVGDQWGGTIGSHPGDLDNFDNSQRTNNAIKYSSPDYDGFTYGGLYSLGGIAGNVTRNQVWSLGAAYSNGPLVLGAAYLNARNPNVSFFGTSSSGTLTAATSNNTSPVFSGYASANTYQVIGAGGNYTIGATTLGANYSNVKFLNLGNTAESGPNPTKFSGDATFNNVEVSLKYQFTPALLAGVEYTYTRGSSVNGRDPAQYNQGTLGVMYSLSKRTDLYIVAVYQKASGVDSTGKPAVAAINQVTASSSDRQTVVSLGFRQKF
ncbi:porin [Paraburkholderia caffeinilytica]|uniref:porin n=1 Tax=Paraburkholderia caffeinilytica TaxID=1761016 RepID=UPI0038BA8081